jgi:AcrR family transcriptional regulator
MAIDTKKVIADAFMEMCKTMPMKLIKPLDIATCCNVSRQTFYNHFRDKQAVVEYIWCNKVGDPVVEFYDYDSWSRKTSQVFEEYWWFFEQALHATDFWNWHEHWVYDNMCRYICINYGEERLTAEIKHYLKTWLTGTCKSIPELVYSSERLSFLEISALNRRGMPAVLYEFFPVRNNGFAGH